jgi:serine/threonine-protein kinase
MAGPEQKYRIIDKLDSGGMAEIYRAEAELFQGMKKKVAIKRILPNLTRNKKFVAMFLDEARLSLYLDHANVVHVFDIGRAGNTYFIVMEYVDGMNLRSLTESLRRQGSRLDTGHALYVGLEICKGLGYAHDMRSPDDDRPLGIVHRDVSPPNILLSRNGEVKLVDFGLAKAASQVEQTEPGVVKGKFSYLAPEAASGQDIDYRADIFACGIILFEMLTGRRLFYGETDYQTVELVRQARIPSFTALNSEVPPELDQVVRRALAREPGDRYQHAYELQDALAQFLFARGLKVTSRDIARLVRRCLEEQQQTVPRKAPSGGVIDTLIQEEILKFTSLDNEEIDSAIGAKPLSPDEIGGSGPLDPRDFVDTRDWTDEFGTDSQPAAMTQEASEVPEITSLETMLEGGDSQDRQPPAPPVSEEDKRFRGVIIALVLFVILGAATILILYGMGFIGSSSTPDNQDIVDPR